ncbi:gephyrin-like molybdotransferase Glp [Lihuaxuella thermophila]|uniref:Molybdopterin molybdenumtransferase n=1 Tax=Lihuaxuella thermophila TaxID=1173111 RepID=A0A1H8ADZ4_9BACL|nr:gephyrin-like molybdotransferase Glp [Lihuaxuella thermophila]SEM67757.1 molybdopterin molybdotransferase [Lihuaxuella thermophila]
MRFNREIVKVAEAQQRVRPYIRTGKTEKVALLDSFGRYLAEDIRANEPLPHFRRSGMDGFAIRSADTKGASRDNPVWFQVIETIPCGSVPEKDVQPGTASRIMTGAAVPNGADAVVMLEMTRTEERDGQVFISVSREIPPGHNITPVGSEVEQGKLLLEKGRKINAGAAALLATFGYAEVEVYKRPRVAVFATGSELLDVESPLQPGKIRNSNSYLLASLLLDAGACPLIHKTLPDDPDRAQAAILAAFDEADLVITTGGVSVGDYDILVDIFERWDGRMLFNKVAMRPGSPTTVGIWKDKFLFALSGNPGACFVGFELFVRPVLKGMQGKADPDLPYFTATMAEDFTTPCPFERFVRAYRYVTDGKVFVKPAGMEKSSITLTIKDTDCLIVVPPGGRGVLAGDQVKVISLAEWE